MLRNNRGQMALIEILVVMVIIVLAAYYMWPAYIGGNGGGSSKGGGKANEQSTYVPTPKQSARGVECQSNLNQVKTAISMYRQDREENPPTLEALGLDGHKFKVTVCPETHQPFTYDPATGEVHCTTPGHDKPGNSNMIDIGL